jgi:flavin reductase (DIM6/NTAB) family NADH-FMN oxidoreductase RutF
MTLESIPFEKTRLKSIDLWLNKWMLLTAGDFSKNDMNTMTVAWGSIGVMWNRPFVQVVVRPTRHTFQFMETFDSFTLCAFPEVYREDLQLLGTKSGRDGDKIALTKLNLTSSKKVAAPSFKEAELILECKKIYWDDFDPTQFLKPTIHKNYPAKDYHRIYFGEILAIFGIKEYLSAE